MLILGIDPGLQRTGYALVETDPCASGRATAPGAWSEPFALVEAGVIRLRPKESVASRLVELESDLCAILGRARPALVCVEALYAHYAHPTTAITMGHARGVILLSVRRAGIDLLELPSTTVKKSLTGNGHASKPQIQRTVQAVLGLAEAPHPSDVADAIAIALCGAQRRGGVAAQ